MTIKTQGLTIEATWDDVLFVGQVRKDELEKFTLDILAEITIQTAGDGFVYELTLDGDLQTYTRQVDETNEDVAVNWILKLLNERSLFYAFSFSAGDFSDTIAIKSKKALVFLPVSIGANLTIREAETAGEPLLPGGRSRILLEVARRCKPGVYGDRLFDAQKYLAAHFALQSLVNPEGLGTVASESFPGESTSWTLPTNNPKAGEEELVTIVGKRFMKIRKTRLVRYRFY